VFEHVVAALVHGSGYERLASPGCSDRTIRRRLTQWAAGGIAERVHALALRAYVAAGANRQDAPLLAPTLQAAIAQVGAMPEQVTAHLDRGYDSATTRILLDEFGYTGEIARKGVPAPVQAGKRWVVERAHAWVNGYGKLRRCTERNARIVDFYLYLAAAFVVVRRLIQQARTRYRWDTRPTTKRLK
jgi:hypothetical protein